jgi:hypothetical protein
MSNPFDPEDIRCNPQSSASNRTRSPTTRAWYPYKPKKGDHFFRGPIPWPWLCTAAKCPGQTLQVAVLLWRIVGFRNALQVPFNQSRADSFGVSREAARRGILALEKAGLISVKRSPGRRGLITIHIDGPQRTGDMK